MGLLELQQCIGLVRMIEAAIAAVGVGLSAFGMSNQKKASRQQNEAMAQRTAAEQRAEALRLKQMKLEGARRQRDVVRQMMVARSTAVSGAANSGTLESSGFEGGQAEIMGRGGQAILAQAENMQIGQGLFQSNVDKMNAELSLGNARSRMAESQGMIDLGKSLVMNSQAIGKNTRSAGSSLFEGI